MQKVLDRVISRTRIPGLYDPVQENVGTSNMVLRSKLIQQLFWQILTASDEQLYGIAEKLWGSDSDELLSFMAEYEIQKPPIR